MASGVPVADLLLGVDIGTSSSKGVLARPDGTIVASAQRPHTVSRPHPGWAEHDAISVWWDDFVAISRELMASATVPLGGVGVSGIGPCLLPLDEAGQPLRPAILYGIDSRATREIAELTEQFGEAAILERGGSLLTAQAVGPKLAWLRRHEPEVWARTRRFAMASSFIVLRLTGEYVLDHHSASQTDPLYDLQAERWSTDWAAEVAPGLDLPRLLWPCDVAGTVTSEAAQLTGIPAGTRVVAGTIDAWAEALSVGVRQPGDMMLMYGTSMFMVQVAQDVRPRAPLWTTTGVFPGTRTLAAGMATSGALTGWFRSLVGDPSFESLVAEAAATERGANGLVVLPYFAGAQSPIFDPDARGVILGLTLDHGRGHIYRALLEGTAYGFRHNLEVMADAGASPERIVAVGGGLRGSLWPRIVSDVTGRHQEIPAESIGAAYGDALLAAIGVGIADPTTTWNRTADVVEPDPAARTRYDELYALYRDLYPATRDGAHRLTRLQEGTRGMVMA
jgi:xylulokinase